MDNQVKNDINESKKEIVFEEKYSKKDLEFLRQIGDIAREFQTEYNSIKEQDSTYQRTK